ncbi:MAG: type II toxin-antitoxin system RelE/ParE family toxin [Acidobacteria bacterium]|nr:type II toxin-antitoxin system RelE/ParE family toxin [Acidobacteriota bacterium]
MRTTFRKSFERDLKKIRDEALLRRIRDTIEEIEAASTLQDLSRFEWLSGTSGFGRIRIGDYRLGIALEGDGVDLVRFLHRREIYRFFP